MTSAKSTIGPTTTYFVGNIYESTDGAVTKYYYAGASRVAMRVNGTLYYLLSDHLGSTTVTADVNGNAMDELKYKPWGEVRAGSAPTNYTFTGPLRLVSPGLALAAGSGRAAQYSNTSDFGLLFYNARWMDPSLGRFTSADTIVPAGIQGLDRYAYVNNSPVNFTDPSGHWANEGCGGGNSCTLPEAQDPLDTLREALEHFNPPDIVGRNEMRTVGIPLIHQSDISPGEYDLLLDEHRLLDMDLLYEMSLIEQEARNAALRRYPEMAQHNDPADAYRHAYWIALMTERFGPEFALAFATAHETGQPPPDHKGDPFMDLHNNEVGAKLALGSPGASRAELRRLVSDALQAGALYVWDGENIYFSDGCPLCGF